ncbi:unnamed protein product [Lymnaea stagnalis]|uniref:Gem-associated protein 7 n=1 Tax=Lymnaea stagnalis TaxID=6523 RepID=A0AAV2I0G0_LYMST
MKQEPQTQEDRTFLRERFLRMLGYLNGTQAHVSMQEKTKVSCKLAAADVDFHHIHVTNLGTPMGIIPKATLRTSDIISIDLPNVDVSKKT